MCEGERFYLKEEEEEEEEDKRKKIENEAVFLVRLSGVIRGSLTEGGEGNSFQNKKEIDFFILRKKKFLVALDIGVFLFFFVHRSYEMLSDLKKRQVVINPFLVAIGFLCFRLCPMGRERKREKESS